MQKYIILIEISSNLKLIECADSDLGVVFLQDYIDYTGGRVAEVGNSYFGSAKSILNEHHVKALVDGDARSKYTSINSLVTDIFGNIVLVNEDHGLLYGFDLKEANKLVNALEELKVQ